MQAQTGPIGAARFAPWLFGPSSRPSRPLAHPHPLGRRAGDPHNDDDWSDTDDEDEDMDEDEDGDEGDGHSWDEEDFDEEDDNDAEPRLIGTRVQVGHRHAHTNVPSAAVSAATDGDVVDGLECIICTDPYRTKMAALPCGHIFHIECALTWINQMQKKNCPHCRKHAGRYIEIYIDKPSRPSAPITTSSLLTESDPASLASNLAAAHHRIQVLESEVRSAAKRLENEKAVSAARMANATAVEAERDRLHIELRDAREKHKRDIEGRDRRHNVIVSHERKAKEAAELLVAEMDKKAAALKVLVAKQQQEVEQAGEALKEERRKRAKVDLECQKNLRWAKELQKKVEVLTQKLQDQQQAHQHQLILSQAAAVLSSPTVVLAHSSPRAAIRPPRPPTQKLPQTRPAPLRAPLLSSTTATFAAPSRAAPATKRAAAGLAHSLSLADNDEVSLWHSKRRKLAPDSLSTSDDAMYDAFHQQETAEVGKEVIALVSSSPIIDRRQRPRHNISGFKKGPMLQSKLMFEKK